VQQPLESRDGFRQPTVVPYARRPGYLHTWPLGIKFLMVDVEGCWHTSTTPSRKSTATSAWGSKRKHAPPPAGSDHRVPPALHLDSRIRQAPSAQSHFRASRRPRTLNDRRMEPFTECASRGHPTTQCCVLATMVARRDRRNPAGFRTGHGLDLCASTRESAAQSPASRAL